MARTFPLLETLSPRGMSLPASEPGGWNSRPLSWAQSSSSDAEFPRCGEHLRQVLQSRWGAVEVSDTALYRRVADGVGDLFVDVRIEDFGDEVVIHGELGDGFGGG